LIGANYGGKMLLENLVIKYKTDEKDKYTVIIAIL
jgi:hypothetical protein